MKIQILADMSIQDLKKQFHGFFPYLKIEFFDVPHQMSSGSSKSSMLDNGVVLKTLKQGVKEGHIEFDALASVNAFEQLFQESFGLYVQVFRKSGNVYIETTKTDDWTLAQQNEEGKTSSSSYQHEAPEDMTDRDQWS